MFNQRYVTWSKNITLLGARVTVLQYTYSRFSRSTYVYMGGENLPVRDVALHNGCEGEPLVEVPPDVGRLSEP